MLKSLILCFAFRCSAYVNSPQDEFATVDIDGPLRTNKEASPVSRRAFVKPPELSGHCLAASAGAAGAATSLRH
jgi:hypothetical protein